MRCFFAESMDRFEAESFEKLCLDNLLSVQNTALDVEATL